MAYAVKEMFKTLQGEGAQAGRAAVFCRFAGCNLWSGRENDRAHAACTFCDTDFVGTDGDGGGTFDDALSLVKALEQCWGFPHKDQHQENRMVVFTGGEPLLQLDDALILATKKAGFFIAVESNGTRPAPAGLDWLCISPKMGAAFVQRHGTELKIIYPQPGLDLKAYEQLAFQYFFLQPMDGPQRDSNTALAIQACLDHPRWRLSVQTHKMVGIR